MGDATTEQFLTQYRVSGRAVWSQELRLTPEERLELREAILTNALEENRQYRYDYYLDNCSTRIRDLLDTVLDGRLGELTTERSPGTTFRSHTRRLLQDLPLSYLGIQFVLGNRADEPITAWDEMFLPIKLMDYVSEVTVERDGILQLLVSERVEVLASVRPPVATSVPNKVWLFLLVGLAWGGAIAGAARLARRGGLAARAAIAVAAGSWSLAAGLGGLILVSAWLFTDHDFWKWNENVLQANPLLLVLSLPTAAIAVRRHLPPWVVRVAGWVAIASFLGLLLQLLPGFDQTNAELLALAIPPNLALAWMTRELAPTPDPGPAG